MSSFLPILSYGDPENDVDTKIDAACESGVPNSNPQGNQNQAEGRGGEAQPEHSCTEGLRTTGADGQESEALERPCKLEPKRQKAAAHKPKLSAKNGNEPGKGNTSSGKSKKKAAAQESLPASRKAALQIIMELINGETLPPGRVEELTTALGPSDLEALAEERALSGKCGNPTCSSPHQHVPGLERQRIDLRNHRTYTEVRGPSNFCSRECELVNAGLLLRNLTLCHERLNQETTAVTPAATAPTKIQTAQSGDVPAPTKVKDSEILANVITEKDPDQVAADTARGLVSCLANEAKASSAQASKGSQRPDSGSVEGFRPKAWKAAGSGKGGGGQGSMKAHAEGPGHVGDPPGRRERRVSFSDDTKPGSPGSWTEGSQRGAVPARPCAATRCLEPEADISKELPRAFGGGRGVGFACCSRHAEALPLLRVEEYEEKRRMGNEHEASAVVADVGGDVQLQHTENAEAASSQPLEGGPGVPKNSPGNPAASIPQRKFKPNVSSAGARRRPVRPLNLKEPRKTLPPPAPAKPAQPPSPPEQSSDDDWEDDLGLDDGLFSSLTEPPDPLSSFGVMHTTLYRWVTAATQRHLAGEDLAEAGHRGQGQPGVREALRLQLSRQLGTVLHALGNQACSRGAAESGIDAVLDTFYIGGPLPAFKVKEWQLVTALVLRALSHHRLPSAAPCLSWDSNSALLQRFLSQLDSGAEEFDLLHDLIYPYE